MHIHPNNTISNPRLRDTPADRNLVKQGLIIDACRSVCHTTEEKKSIGWMGDWIKNFQFLIKKVDARVAHASPRVSL